MSLVAASSVVLLSLTACGRIGFSPAGDDDGSVGSGGVGPWTATTGFSPVRQKHGTVAYGGYIYIIGGLATNNGPLTDVQYARIDPDGTIAAWNVTSALPTARSNMPAVVYNGFIYITGGFPLTNEVLFAPVNGDGTLGAWTATTPLPTSRRNHGSFVDRGHLVVVSGWDGTTYLPEVYSATLAGDGTVGAWTTTTPLPNALDKFATVVHEERVYVYGGTQDMPVFYSSVQFAPINADGTLGTWTATTSMPASRARFDGVTYSGNLYALGGTLDGATRYNDVIYAPIAADGTVGTWHATGSFQTVREHNTAIEVGGRVYILGGTPDNNTVLGDVQFASFR